VRFYKCVLPRRFYLCGFNSAFLPVRFSSAVLAVRFFLCGFSSEVFQSGFTSAFLAVRFYLCGFSCEVLVVRCYQYCFISAAFPVRFYGFTSAVLRFYQCGFTVLPLWFY
jgi:hypothetical protein